MSKRSSLEIDWSLQLQIAHYDTRAQVKVVLHDLQDLLVGFRSSSIGVDEQGHWVGNTNGVGDLHEAAVGQTGSHDGLSDPAGSVGSRAIDLSWVLSRESATS